MEQPKTCAEAIRLAAEKADAAMAQRATDILREHGFNYKAIYDIAKQAGITAAEWDALLNEEGD